MPTFYALEAKRIRLRRFRDEDLPSFVAYRNDPEVARYQSWHSMNETAARSFLDELRRVDPGVPGEWYQFAISLRSTDELIGDCALQIKAEDPRQGEIGFTLSRQQQGKGLAFEAVSTLLHYVFTTLNLHRVIAQVDCRNTRSIALLERLGMRREGHFLQGYWLKGAWIDEYLYAVLQKEWVAQQQQHLQATANTHLP
jgi:RimJ/RimL family protein N-acetyltransferase